ncbi:MAG TPA: phage virion morphogenesis protein [Thermoanaerobaculia bacterium]|nr:phage virion morphogenesis protein [Thermoanaerobaculia bacterium]
MRITLTLEGAAEAQHLLEATASRLERSPRPLLETLAAKLQLHLQNHIRHQTGPEGPWPPLAPATRKIREYYGHPPDAALIRSGDLLQSITTLALEDRAVEVGTPAPFARTLQDGGSISHPTTGRPRTVQAFPFAFVTAGEVQDLVAFMEAFYFEDNHFSA